MSSSSDDQGRLTRRAVLAGGAAMAAALGGVGGALGWRTLRQPHTRVATLSATSYEADLVDLLYRGIREFPDTVLRVKGAHVVLKPNLVEYDQHRPINTHPRMVAAAAEAFRKLGAARVTVAEGPGHRRDTELMAYESGLEQVLRDLKLPFVDLNVDVPVAFELSRDFTGLGRMPIAQTVLAADFVVSMPKMKTHHWVGATLSMKNLFGTVPGAKVGWPKNPLHWAGIDRSIVDLWLSIQPDFAIVDGIVGMEGDGPIRGSAVPMGVVVLGEQCPAVDATAARLMGIDPERMSYLSVAGDVGGTVAASRIERIGDEVAPRDFALLPSFAHLRG